VSLHGFLTRLIWLCVLPLVVLAAYLGIVHVRSMQAARDLEASNLATNFATAIDQNLEARIAALNMLAASSDAVDPGRWKDLYQEAQSFAQSFGSHVVLADLDRRVLFTTRAPFGTPLPTLPQLITGHSAFLGAVGTGKVAVGDSFLGPLVNEPMVAIAVPVVRDGETSLVLITTVELRQFQERLDQLALPSGWSLALLDGSDKAIARRQTAQADSAVDAASSRRFVVKSAVSPWSVALEIPHDIYQAPLVAASTALAVAILGFALIGVLGGMLASRRLARSVASLALPPGTAAAAPHVGEISEIGAVRRLLDESAARRESAESARQASEQRFRAIFELAAVGIATLAADGRWLQANKKLCDIVGYSHDELLRKTFQDVTHPDDLTVDLAHVDQLLSGEIDSYSMEKRYLRKDGSVVWINLTAALVRHADGRPDYFISVVEDIQRRKEAEAALLARESALREAQRLAGIGNWTWDLASDEHTWSEEIYRLYGHDRDVPVLPYPQVQAYFTPATWTRLASAIEECRTHGTAYACDAEVVRSDGVHRWVTGRGAAERNGDGQIVELHGTLQDITERKLADEKLRVSDLALKAISQGVLMTTPDGRILSANDAFLAISGYRREEILGRTCRFIQGPLTDPATIAAIRLALDNGREFSGDILNYRKDGSIFWNELTIAPVRDEQGQPTLFIGIIRDITARKKAEEELDQHRHHLEQLVLSRTAELAEARDAAEAANRAKSAFLATMSHEIRTPLAAVLGLTGLLADSPLDRRQRDYADKIQWSAQSLRTLIDNILDFSKIEAGALRLEQAPFSLNAILRTTAAVISAGTRDKPVEALFDVAPEVPDALVGDALRVQQILLNLTGNAVKFTDAGVIVVAVRRLAQEAERVTLQFAVRDTGIGIPPDKIDQIFEVFAQAESSTSRTYGGSGLGLAISAKLAALMGSCIEIESTLGRGSEFRFAVTFDLAAGAPAERAQDGLAGLRLLIIDDHPLARELLTQTCAAFGWQATALDSGAAGLAELRRSTAENRHYDLLLLDWHMPGMDGIDMLRQAQTAADISLPLVVLMASTYELEQAVAASDDLYLDSIVAKPITPATLYDAVARAHSGDFSGRLPVAAPGKTDRRLAGMRLLVVDDNDLNQLGVRQLLAQAGAEVVIAASGPAALAALRLPGARFDAVLMDIQMPLMDGYATARAIRDELGRVDLPIIAVTACAQPEDREKSRQAGMVGHVVKPINVDDLLDILTAAHRVAPGHRGQPGAASRPAADAAPGALTLPGIDVAEALKAFGGDAKKYAAIVRRFVAGHGADVAQARRLFAAGEAKSAASLVRGLRGMASIVRAMEIARVAAETESAIGNADAVPPLFDELQAAMRTLAESIDRIDAVAAGAAASLDKTV
jgi:PAS domain S-box-containing protein